MALDKLNAFSGLRLAALRAKGYIADQIAALSASLEGIFEDINSSLETCETHAESAHAPANAEENAIISIKKNGVAIAPINKVVDISVPTNTNELTNGAGYQTASDVETTLSNRGYMVTEIVASVPAAVSADANTIYYVARNGGGYLEYQLINGEMVCIGANAADLSGFVTASDVAKASSELITSIVNTKTSSEEKYVGTGNLAAFWSLISERISGNGSDISSLEARVEALELFLTNGEITGNPYSVTFDDLDRLSISGVWNESSERVEF